MELAQTAPSKKTEGKQPTINQGQQKKQSGN
jgi:hypothetical protein